MEEFRFANTGLLTGETLSDLETNFEQGIASEIMDTADKLRYELEADAYQLEQRLKKTDYKLYLRYADENWQESFKEMEIEPVVRVKITGGSVIK